MPSLFVMLGLDGKSFAANLSRSKALAKEAGKEISDSLGGKITSSLVAIGTAIGLKKLMSEAAELGQHAKDIRLGSDRLNTDQQRFQQLEKAVDRAGSSMAAIYTAYRKIAVGATDALDGNLELQAAFNTLGVTLTDLQNKSPDEIFQKIANNLSGAEVGASKLAALIKTMGKGADELVPGLKSGVFGQSNPFALPDSDLKALEDFKKNLGIYKGVAKSIFESFLAESVKTNDAPGSTLFSSGFLSTMFARGAKFLKKQFGIQDQQFSSRVDLKTVGKSDLEEQKNQSKEISKIADMMERIRDKERENSRIGLSDAAKLVDLEKERLDLITRIRKEKDFDKLRELDLKLLDIEGRIREAKTKGRANTNIQIGANELQRVGAFAANPNSSLETIAREQLKVQKEQAATLRKITRPHARSSF